MTGFHIKRFSLLLVAGIFHFSVFAQIADPIPQPIEPSGITVILEDHVQLPPSSSSAPRARINMLREADDGSGRLFVNDLNGRMFVISGNAWDIYMDVKTIFPDFIAAPGKGTGFGCFAFHPEFKENGLFYTVHAETAGAGDPDFTPVAFDHVVLQWVVYEWKASNPAAAVFEGSRREILRADFPDFLHGFQEIAFNPTAKPGDEDYGLLYLCIGDGGSSKNFQPENLQTRSSYLGSIFRIDPAGNNSVNGAYGIPPGNPFIGDPGAVQEIYCYGFRNPHRISWDSAEPHQMLIGDIGEMNIEEVNIGRKGANYGWSEREGTFLYHRPLGREFVFQLPDDDSIYQYTYPVSMYDHDEGYAIVGGFVYRRDDIPDLKGKYLFGDIVNGRIFLVDADSLQEDDIRLPAELILTDQTGNVIDLQKLEGNGRADLRFGQDLSGNVYILTKADGVIRKLRSPTASATNEKQHHGIFLKVTPNPVMDLVHWSCNHCIVDQVLIHDMSGNCQRERTVQSSTGTITVSDLPAGAYMLTIRNKEKTGTKIFFINR